MPPLFRHSHSLRASFSNDLDSLCNLSSFPCIPAASCWPHPLLLFPSLSLLWLLCSFNTQQTCSPFSEMLLPKYAHDSLLQVSFQKSDGPRALPWPSPLCSSITYTSIPYHFYSTLFNSTALLATSPLCNNTYVHLYSLSFLFYFNSTALLATWFVIYCFVYLLITCLPP